MSAIHVIEYIGGLAFFGFLYWIMNGILVEFLDFSETGAVYNLALYVWPGIIIVYLIFGGIWVVRKYNERQYIGGGGW